LILLEFNFSLKNLYYFLLRFQCNITLPTISLVAF